MQVPSWDLNIRHLIFAKIIFTKFVYSNNKMGKAYDDHTPSCTTSQPGFKCSKLTIKPLKHGVKYVQS